MFGNGVEVAFGSECAADELRAGEVTWAGCAGGTPSEWMVKKPIFGIGLPKALASTACIDDME